MPRKHLIASAINKKQQQQSKLALKCVKEIKAAVKVGGINPEANPRLKAAISRALDNNLTRDTIQRNIANSKDADNLKELTYEGYGPRGLAIIVKTLTDNEQRTISNLRGYFSKLHGEISKPNSVKMLFDEYGQFIIANNNKITEDDILEMTLNYNVVDLKHDDSAFELLVQPVDYFDVKQIMNDNTQVELLSSEVKLIPNAYVDINEQEDIALQKFIASCEDDDDIQWVVTNVGDII